MRYIYIEYLRVFAALSVITIHVTAGFYNDADYKSMVWWTANVLNSFSRFCVPMFVVISGAVLLSTSNSVVSFYKSRAARLLPPFIFWSVFYIFYSMYTQGVNNEMAWNLKNDIVSKGKTYYHLWYLSMFLCLMLFVPYIGNFLNGIKPTEKEIRIFIGLCAGFFILNLFSSIVLNVYQIEVFWYKTFPLYIIYLVSGYYIQKYVSDDLLSNKFIAILAFISFILIILGVFGNYILVSHFYIVKDYLVLDNTGPFVLFITLAIFLIFKKFNSKLPNNSTIKTIADATFGVYLIHPVFIDITKYCLEIYTEELMLILILQILLTAIFSFLAIHIIRKSKILRIFC